MHGRSQFKKKQVWSYGSQITFMNYTQYVLLWSFNAIPMLRFR